MGHVAEEKVAVITGANKGIGKTIAEELSSNGYNVVVCSRTIARVRDVQFISMRCNVTKKRDVEKLIRSVISEYGRIDVLINNAGLMLYDKFENVKEYDIDKMYSVHVKGTLFFIQAVLPIMKKQRHGYIFNISSIRGVTGAPYKAAYSATKFAIRGLSETVLAENKESGIKVTTICPGMVLTDSTKDIMKGYGLRERDVMKKSDISKTILYLLTLSPKAHVREIILGGQL